MPKESDRLGFIKDTEQALILQEMDSSSDGESSSDHDDDDIDHDDDDIWMLYTQLQCNRYLEPCKRIAQAPDHLDWLYFELDDKRFKQEVRITRNDFNELVVKIGNHPIFQSNTHNKQRPVYHQLMVAMKRFGCFGNGAAVGAIARYFSVSGNPRAIYTFLAFLLLLIIIIFLKREL